MPAFLILRCVATLEFLTTTFFPSDALELLYLFVYAKIAGLYIVVVEWYQPQHIQVLVQLSDRQVAPDIVKIALQVLDYSCSNSWKERSVFSDMLGLPCSRNLEMC